MNKSKYPVIFFTESRALFYLYPYYFDAPEFVLNKNINNTKKIILPENNCIIRYEYMIQKNFTRGYHDIIVEYNMLRRYDTTGKSICGNFNYGPIRIYIK
ncbi:MAG: hypothetical protein Fur0023_17060 [Bacteroidia bacterium]